MRAIEFAAELKSAAVERFLYAPLRPALFGDATCEYFLIGFAFVSASWGALAVLSTALYQLTR